MTDKVCGTCAWCHRINGNNSQRVNIGRCVNPNIIHCNTKIALWINTCNNWQPARQPEGEGEKDEQF